jgi:hypothetical protein
MTEGGSPKTFPVCWLTVQPKVGAEAAVEALGLRVIAD